MLGKQLTGAGTVLIFTLGVTLLYIWLFAQSPVQASFRSFWIPFLGSLAVLSTFVQLLICRLSEVQDKNRNSAWSYVGSELGFKQLQELLKWARLNVHLEHVRPEHLANTFSSRYIVDR